MKLLLSAFLYLVIEISSDDDSGWSLEDNPLVTVQPCNGSTDIQLVYERHRSPEEENQYNLWIHKKFPKNTVIKMKFDKGATVILSNQSAARIDLDKSDEHAFKIRFFRSHEGICLHVQGCTLGLVPYIKSVNINTKEYCKHHVMGFLDSYIEGYKLNAQSSCAEQKLQQNVSCGKRKNIVIPLSVQGEAQRNDWPWHVALFRKIDSKPSQYLCGGTLISSYYVLTAAHCVFLPNSGAIANLTVGLGKYYLNQRMELGTHEKEIEKTIYHENFNRENLNYDIALLKMKTEATFTENIQPACLWNVNANERLTSKPIMGTIIGWGIVDDNTFANKLIEAQIPMIPHITCLRNKPSFYSIYLNDMKFCGGLLNEALACTGDSGGGFHVFVPDKVGDNSTGGSWYIRGIISLGVANEELECSGDHYTVFTDVDKYREWILSHMQ